MALYSISVDAIALAAATAKSIAELATPATVRIKVTKWWVMFDGVTASAVPVKVEIGRFSAAVTTATTITPDKIDPADGASAVTAKHTTTTEGAGTFDDGEIYRVSPTSGLLIQEPLGRESIVLPVSGFARIRITAAAVVNVAFGLQWEE